MPIPKKGEKQDDFISRCIPIVINEGTTDDPSQAAAICHSIWEKAKKKSGIEKIEDILKVIKESGLNINDINYVDIVDMLIKNNIISEESFDKLINHNNSNEDPIIETELIKKEIPINLRGNLDILKKSKDKRIICGYASVAIIDSENDYIPTEVLKYGLETLMEDPLYSNLMLKHNSVKIGQLLREYDGHKTHVDDKGLFIVAELRTDIKTADITWEKILSGEYKGFSILGEILEYHRECDDKSCIKVIDKMNLLEVSICQYEVNKESNLRIIAKSKVNCACGEHDSLIINENVSTMSKNNDEVIDMADKETLNEENQQEEVQEKSNEMKIKEISNELSELLDIEASKIIETLESLQSPEEEEEEEEIEDEEDEEEEEEEMGNDNAPEDITINIADIINASLAPIKESLETLVSTITEKLESINKSDEPESPQDDEGQEDLEMAVKARDDAIEQKDDEIKKLQDKIKDLQDEVEKLKSIEEKPVTENDPNKNYVDEESFIKKRGQFYKK